MELLGTFSVDSGVDQLLIRYLHSSDTGEKMGLNETVHKLFIDLTEGTIHIGRKYVLYSIPFHFGIHTELARIIKICLNGTYSKVV
jgi:hypothetical protein